MASEALSGEILEPARALAIDELLKAPAYNARRNAGAVKLTDKHRAAIESLAHGLTSPVLAAKIGVEIGVPLTIPQAAECFGYQRRFLRRLMVTPEGVKLVAELVSQLRNGKKFDAQRRLNELVDEKGDGSAAWAKVSADAARSILELGGSNAPVQVNVSTNVMVAKGLVVDLRDDTPEEIAARAALAKGP
jgi:hypothetical protein